MSSMTSASDEEDEDECRHVLSLTNHYARTHTRSHAPTHADKHARTKLLHALRHAHTHAHVYTSCHDVD